MGKKSAPPAPDYAAAAREQGQASMALTEQQTRANRPNINTPWGSQTWTQNGDQWTSNITLSPQEQSALDSQMAIQQGRSGAAQTLLGQATSAFQTPMDWDSMPQRSAQISAPQLGPAAQFDPSSANSSFQGTQLTGAFGFGGPVQSRVGSGGQIQSSVGPQGEIQTSLGERGPIQSAFSFGGPIQSQIADSGQVRGTIGDRGDIQQRLTSDPSAFRTQAQDAITALQRPEFDYRRQATQTQLANQGLAQGSEAWNREMNRLDDSEARARLMAIEAGRAEAAQMFGQDLASGQFANQAQAQDFSQLASEADFANRAQGQVFGQNVTSGQFANQAQNQEFAQNQSAADFANRAQAQDFGQDVTAGEFANRAQAQDFGQDVTAGQFVNQAQAQRFGQGVTAGEFANRAQAQRFGQGQSVVNQANQIAGQQFAQNQTQAEFENAAQQREFNNMLLLAQYGDQRALQQLQMMIQAGQFNNQNRQSAISEETMRRGQPLNELNALLTGQQVNMPTMPGFTNAGRAETPDLLGAANSQYGASLDAYNARMGQINNAANLGLAAFQFSDARLKEDIQYTGTSVRGVPVVHYRYRGLPGRHVGVIAQDVLTVHPGLVALDPSGFYKVNYSELFA